MYMDRLRALLDEGGIVPGNVQRIVTLCKEWFLAEPNLTTFILRSMFGELARNWDDPQGVQSPNTPPSRKNCCPD
jgi:hypothetical protein